MSLPQVSVIAPVYNDEKRVGLLIESLINQDYPKDKFEVIIVDNNSQDNTRAIVQKYSVTLLVETRIQSSYAARNTGLSKAKGEIIAFIDSDCIADPCWLKEGVAAIADADLVGGKVEFFYSPKKTGAEYYDSLIHMQFNKDPERKVAATCNLFIKASLFDQIGLFPDNVKSGGDYQWTGNATSRGFSLKFESKAIVRHPTRSLNELLKKQMRTGAGKPYTWLNNNEPVWQWKRILFAVKPPSRTYIRSLIDERGKPEMHRKFWNIWMVCYIGQFFYFFGILSGIAKISVSGNKKKAAV